MDTGIFIGDKIITTSWDKIWNKPNTLSGYGITDAYTKTDADSRYFRHIGDTYEDGRNTGWIGFGTGTYIEAYPDGIAHKIYSYGQVTSFNSGYSRLELYSNHYSSDPNDGPNGIQFRSGWNDDKKSWRMLLDEVNYLHYTDNRYVNKAGDTMTGDLIFAHTSERPSYSDSIGIAFREQTANRQGVKLVYNDYDNYRAPAGLILVGEQGGEYFEAPAIYQNGYKVWDAGNDGSGSGLDADLLDGKHLGNVGDRVMRQIGFPHHNEFGSTDTNVYLRKVLGWCYNNVNTGAADTLFVGVGHPNSLGNMQIQVYCSSGINEEGYPRYSTGMYFPLTGNPTMFGTNDFNYIQRNLAFVDDNVESANRLYTPRSLWGQTFDGTGDVNGTIHVNSGTHPIILSNSGGQECSISYQCSEELFVAGVYQDRFFI